ncbi:MAG: hypothetical protein ABI682_10280 [Acidobacteriota bacterium]
MTFGRSTGWIAALLAGLGLFSLGFSLLAERGLWPELPPGALHDTDLFAGFAVVLGLIGLLLREEARGMKAARASARAAGEERSVGLEVGREGAEAGAAAAVAPGALE